MMKILLVEDNEVISKGLSYSLKKEGFEIDMAKTKNEARIAIEKERYDLIILDVALPDGTGFDLYEEKISLLSIPTIFLTAKDEEDDIVYGLNIGAEDYMTKPFSTKELLARINRIIYKNKKRTTVNVKDIEFDLDKMEVYRNKEKIELTSLELKILHLLFLNVDKVVRRNSILDKIWEWTGNDVDDHTVTVYLKRIREKVGDDLITTIKGIGYRIDSDGQ
ncbi:MAG: response regulator transcription factor [Bacilli bacterium]|nr:response regulator transcription factor [Bacilli bacterium]